MKFFFRYILLCVFISSCSSIQRKPHYAEIRNLDDILNQAEEKATPEGREILMTGRKMVEKEKVVTGSCWDYTNAVYNASGFKADQRLTPLKSKINGPYADLSTIKAGDWLYFINYSFKKVDHSGIFVEWTDFGKQKGVILSYVGGKKKKPGQYRIYDLKHVYYIIRPK